MFSSDDEGVKPRKAGRRQTRKVKAKDAPQAGIWTSARAIDKWNKLNFMKWCKEVAGDGTIEGHTVSRAAVATHQLVTW